MISYMYIHVCMYVYSRCLLLLQSHLFHLPVNSKEVADYHRIVTKPMDLQTMKTKIRERKYESREVFLADVHQIYENSRIYNGLKSVLTLTAQKMVDLTLCRFAEVRDDMRRSTN